MKQTLLLQTTNEQLTHIVNIYKQGNKQLARVLFMNNGPIDLRRKVLFEKDNGDFNIVQFRQRWNVSKRSIIYKRETRELDINRKGNNIYIASSNGIVQRMSHCIWSQLCDEDKKIIIERIPQLRFLTEFFKNIQQSNNLWIDTSWMSYQIGYVCHRMSLSSMLKHKLFNSRDCIRHLYKTDANTARDLIRFDIDLKEWKVYKDFLIVTKFPPIEEYNKQLFKDLLKIARILNRKVDISWSANRIKDTHDKWAKELNLIVLQGNERQLNVKPIFKDIAEKTQLELIDNTKELALEGLVKHHCVGSYVQSVDSGKCGIYKVGDYTLELREDNDNSLQINQFRGLYNKEAPIELFQKVYQTLSSFFKVKRPYQLGEEANLTI